MNEPPCGFAPSFHDALGPVDLERAVARAMQNLSAALSSSEATIKLGRLPTVRGKECDLIRVFQNLISNAVKYRTEMAIEVRIDAERLGPDWVIRLHDNGIGIPTEHHRRVFGLFTRLHGEEMPGAGVGLAVCKKIVEGMGGAIWVDSEPGAGSTFCFTVAAESAYAADTSD
jgi:light-regulated signal transduction histidine kinase (bacteriophytochrome)